MYFSKGFALSQKCYYTYYYEYLVDLSERLREKENTTENTYLTGWPVVKIVQYAP
jgi:hypothetical protein